MCSLPVARIRLRSLAWQVGNCGDSRAVLYSGEGGSPQQLSLDHKPYLPEEEARINAAGGAVIFQRVDGESSSAELDKK